MLRRTKSLRSLCLIVGVLLCSPLPLFAQEVVTCTSDSSDADGDGWGWENNTSCRVADEASVNDVNCIDTDGDGWGWDGVSSCRGLIEATAPIESNTCVDTDGDGWGWDGVSSCRILIEATVPAEAANCVDVDGDGYGWDGTQTCIIDGSMSPVVMPGQETVIEPYLNSYQTTTEISWGTSRGIYQRGPVTEAITNGWIEGSPDAPLGYPEAYSSGLVLCEDLNTTLEDPSNPGLFFDAAQGKTCTKTGTLAIPAPEPVEFSAIGVEVLYENGNQWTCNEETRLSMDSEFEPNGNTGDMTFDPSGVATIRIGNQTYTDGWDMSGVSLFLYSFRARSILSTPVSYTDSGLTLYRSGLTRLQCQRISEENYPFSLYGENKGELYREMWNAFLGDSTPKAKLTQLTNLKPVTDFERLSSNQLLGRTMQCGEIYGQGTLGVSFDTVETIESVTAVGGDEYDFSGAVWTEIENGEFEMRGGSSGSRSVYYRYTDNLSLRYTYWSGAIGSSSGFKVTVAACESSATE